MSPIVVNTQSDFSISGLYYIISSDITLSDNLNLSGVYLEFRGGQISLNGYDIHFNDTTILAPGYKLFIGSLDNINGQLANVEINADWFGAATTGLCTRAVNTAIRLCSSQTVVMPSREYSLDANDISPIIMDKNGMSLVCNGQINCSSSSLDCVFDLRAEHINLLIHRIDTNVKVNRCSAIRVSGNVYDSNIKTDFISGFHKGLDFSPKFYYGATYSGVQRCRFEWQMIGCDSDIHFDFYAGADYVSTQTEQYSVWFTDNYFLGGRLQGGKAFFMQTEPTDLPDNYHLYTPTDCVFENVGFERKGQTAINIHDCENFTFKDCRISAGELANENGSGSFIFLNNCRNVRIDNKCGFSLNNIESIESHNVMINNHNYSDWPMTHACVLPTTASSSDKIAYCHSETNAHNRIAELSFSGTGNSEIRFDEIFPDVAGGAKLLTKFVRLAVSGGMTLKIRCFPNQILALPDVTFVCVLTGSSGVQFISNNVVKKAAYSDMIINSHELVEL